MAPPLESAFLTEREIKIGHLERGSVITKYYVKKKPEKRMLAVRRETMLVVWYKAINTRNMFEGAVDIREIKEIRKTKNSREFERWLGQTVPDPKNSADKLFVVRKKFIHDFIVMTFLSGFLSLMSICQIRLFFSIFILVGLKILKIKAPVEVQINE